MYHNELNYLLQKFHSDMNSKSIDFNHYLWYFILKTFSIHLHWNQTSYSLKRRFPNLKQAQNIMAFFGSVECFLAIYCVCNLNFLFKFRVEVNPFLFFYFFSFLLLLSKSNLFIVSYHFLGALSSNPFSLFLIIYSFCHWWTRSHLESHLQMRVSAYWFSLFFSLI